jgi:hypothetical protein
MTFGVGECVILGTKWSEREKVRVIVRGLVVVKEFLTVTQIQM